MERLVLGVDLDEVLGAHAPACAAYYQETYGHRIPVTTMNEYFTLRFLGCEDSKVAGERMAGFQRGGHARHMLPLRESLEDAPVLAEYADLYVVTARQTEFSSQTEAWVDEHYPGVFRDVISANHFSDGPSISKVEICEKINAVGLVDDNNHARLVAESGRLGFLFKAYPWNHSIPAHPNLIQINRLRDVVKYFRGLGA